MRRVRPEGISKAARTAIAERRKAALHKLGVFYDFEGEYLQKITRNQLETLGRPSTRKHQS
jgi:hypothetical protein